jgi:hypothetical protein
MKKQKRTLLNPKGAGRKAIHDKGIRHIKRPEIKRASPLHLTIKVKKAQIQNKYILKSLKHAIMRARRMGLKIIHYSLEHDHVHLYTECSSNEILTKSMKAFGVSFAKNINAHFKSCGQVYKTRFHLRILKSATEVKHVINYILKNGIKHKRTKSVFDPYNTSFAIHHFKLLGGNLNWAQIKKNHYNKILELRKILDALTLYRKELNFVMLST